jgi:hypothetical protein
LGEYPVRVVFGKILSTRRDPFSVSGIQGDPCPVFLLRCWLIGKPSRLGWCEILSPLLRVSQASDCPRLAHTQMGEVHAANAGAPSSQRAHIPVLLIDHAITGLPHQHIMTRPSDLPTFVCAGFHATAWISASDPPSKILNIPQKQAEERIASSVILVGFYHRYTR